MDIYLPVWAVWVIGGAIVASCLSSVFFFSIWALVILRERWAQRYDNRDLRAIKYAVQRLYDATTQSADREIIVEATSRAQERLFKVAGY